MLVQLVDTHIALPYQQIESRCAGGAEQGRTALRLTAVGVGADDAGILLPSQVLVRRCVHLNGLGSNRAFFDEILLGNVGAARESDVDPDRKSTRLNSSHLVISYA